MPRPKGKQNARGKLGWSLRNRNARGHVTHAIIPVNLQEEKTGTQTEHPDQAPALTARTPQCGHGVCGKTYHELPYFFGPYKMTNPSKKNKT